MDMHEGCTAPFRQSYLKQSRSTHTCHPMQHAAIGFSIYCFPIRPLRYAHRRDPLPCEAAARGGGDSERGAGAADGQRQAHRGSLGHRRCHERSADATGPPSNIPGGAAGGCAGRQPANSHRPRLPRPRALAQQGVQVRHPVAVAPCQMQASGTSSSDVLPACAAGACIGASVWGLPH